MQNNQRHHYLFIIIAVTAVIAGFWLFNPFSLYFLNDDFIHIPLSKDGTLFQRKSFRPVCDLSVALDYFLWKKEASGYHFTNLFLHVVDSCLVYALVKLFFIKYTSINNQWAFIFAGILFFVFPFHSEAIFWVIGRSASLGSLFFLTAIIFYIQRGERSYHFLLSLLFFSVGLLTYESVWIFPVIAFGISLVHVQSGLGIFKTEARYIFTLILIFIIFLVIRYLIIGEIAGNYEAASFKGGDLKNLALNFVRLLVRSFAPPAKSIIIFYVFAALVFIVLVLLSIYLSKKEYNKKYHFQFLFISLIGSYIPYLSLGIDTHGSEGERFLYLPSIFICMLTSGFIFSAEVKYFTKICLSLFILGYSIYFLFQSQRNYAYAGKITKETIAELQKLEGKNRLFIDSLPEECNGAVVFRSGFKEAVMWMKPMPVFNNIYINSSLRNIENVAGDYKVIYKDSSFLQKQKEKITDWNPTTDVSFIYSDSALTVVK